MTGEEREEQARQAHDEEILRRAGNAQDLLEKPLLVEAFAYLKDRYSSNVMKADSRDHDAIDENHRMFKALLQVEAELREVVKSGKIVDKKREQREYQAAVLKEDEE